MDARKPYTVDKVALPFLSSIFTIQIRIQALQSHKLWKSIISFYLFSNSFFLFLSGRYVENLKRSQIQPYELARSLRLQLKEVSKPLT